MSLHPARDEAAAKKKREEIELCGKNRGPHDYMPIEWLYVKDDKGNDYKRVSHLLCRVCFCNVNTSTLLANYNDVSVNVAQNHDTSG